MSLPRFLQIHTLTSYPAVLLNRDDAGLAKRITYGGTVRVRVSSQSLKRHWRKAEDADWSLSQIGLPMSVRSREVFEYAIEPELLKRLPGGSTEAVTAAGAALSVGLYGDKAGDVRKRQALLLGWRELAFLTDRLVEILTEHPTPETAAAAVNALFKGKMNRKALSNIRESGGALTAGLEAALFGRMVTSDPAANTDAAIHVAHAFTVQQQESETDYFTVVDDLKQRDENQDAGSAGIFDTELTSGLFYGYVVVDLPLLVANITGNDPAAWDAKDLDRTVPAKVVEHLVHLIATVSPGAKKGSTAPYAWTQMMLVEAGSRQPRTLASAFERPVRSTATRSASELAEDALFERLAAFDRVYGAKEARCFIALRAEERPEARGPLTLDTVAAWAAACVIGAGTDGLPSQRSTPLQPQS
jgi:CRISPR system Cascade subunit CasC